LESEGRHYEELAAEELWGLFDLIDETGRSLQRKDAASAFNTGRNPTTVGRALNVAQGIWDRDPDCQLDDLAIHEIAKNAGYDTKSRYIRWIWQEHRAWVNREASSQPEDQKAGGLLRPGSLMGLVYEIDERCWRTKTVRPLHRGGKLTKDFGPIGPEATSSCRASAVVGLGDGELALLRVGAADDVQVGVVSGRERMGLADKQWVTPLTTIDDPDLALTEFWLSGGNPDLRIEVRNPTRYLIKFARAYFRGWVVEGELVTRPKSGVTVIREGWAK
jgi:hypothetical protein